MPVITDVRTDPMGYTRVRTSKEISDLLDRLRKLVADQQRLDGYSLRANRRVVARLQRRLATIVRRDLAA